MGLKGSAGDDDLAVDDGEGGGRSVPCSICLEVVTDNGDRAWAKLQCGHQFHLDCIGSAFNCKGAMQCPNCRKTEKGQWLYATGCRSLPEFSLDEWAHEEDLYDLSYSEMTFGVHWCPYGQLPRLPSFEGCITYQHRNTDNDLRVHHAMFSEQSSVSSAAHPCPYIAYFGPIHPSTSSSNGSIPDGTNFSNPWNGPSLPSEVPNSYAFPAMDVQFHSWDQSPFSTSSRRIGNADQPSIPPTTVQRSSRTNSELTRPTSFMHPFLVGHSSGARSGSSVPSSLIPPYTGSNARARNRGQALPAFYQQQPSHSRTPIAPGTRRSTTHRGMSHMGSVASSSSEQSNGFYFIPASSSGTNFQEPENPLSGRFHAWERDYLQSFQPSQVDRESTIWHFHQPASGSEPGIRSNSFRLRHGSERTPHS
ncbi:hypothetical protein ACJRO7_011122 [Eucalyptus globulus]|uniref:RING-type domain-containing protein n=1 Tax=Eucalyptus globulus TaxID=34317 RepID=A0ABD3LF00_EUCGL